MNNINIYNGINLPIVLSNEEFKYYYYQFKEGNQLAREKLINHNLRLIIDVITKSFYNTTYDCDELFSIGTIGLIKAVDTYDINKFNKFSTYASRCIANEILMVLRKDKNKPIITSLDEPIKLEDSDNLKLKDTIETDELTLEDNFINNEEQIIIHNTIHKTLSTLPERERDIIMMYFGFHNEKRYLQKEIAKKYNLTQPSIARVISKTLLTIKKEILIAKENTQINHEEYSNNQKIDLKRKTKSYL